MTDNAGGGRRGFRATPSPELLKALHQHYQIDVRNEVIDFGGSSSLNLVAADDQHKYIIRVYRPYVTEARLGSIHLVQDKLADQGIPCPQRIATHDGWRWIRLADRLMEVEIYVEHDGIMNSWERLKTGLPLLGRIHSILRDVEVGEDARKPLFANHIEPLDTIRRTRDGVQRIRTWNPSQGERKLADDAEALAQLVYNAEQSLVRQLPKQIVHGDFWDNNVLFRDGQVVLIADFDFMGERTRIDDLALTLYFTLISLTSPEDAVSDDTLRRLHGLVDAYNSGLDAPLTPVERAALPLAIARQPLWSIGGWIAQLDDEESARRHAASVVGKVEFALRIVHELDRWQAALA